MGSLKGSQDVLGAFSEPSEGRQKEAFPAKPEEWVASSESTSWSALPVFLLLKSH